jgi:hypothetical protein
MAPVVRSEVEVWPACARARRDGPSAQRGRFAGHSGVVAGAQAPGAAARGASWSSGQRVRVRGGGGHGDQGEVNKEGEGGAPRGSSMERSPSPLALRSAETCTASEAQSNCDGASQA